MRRALAALILLSATHARAQLSEQLWQLGAQLEALGASEPSETRLELNGATLDLATLTSKTDLRDVLQRFDALCAVGSLQTRRTSDSALAVCLTHPDSAVRYVRARRLPGGGVHVLFVRSRGPLPLPAMFPAHGDAAGSDLAGLPRPAAARRVLSARLTGSGHAMVAYEVAGETPAALAAYARSLQQHGYMQLEVAGATETRAFSRGSELLVVHGAARNRQSVLSAVRLGNAPPAAAGIALATEPEQRD